MGQAVVETLITWIEGLDDAPAENTEGALQIAQKLAAEPPEHGEPDVRGSDRRRDRGREPHVRVQRPRLPRVHPRRRALHGGARRVPGAGPQPLRRPVAAEPGDGPAGGERHPVALLAVRLPGGVAGPADHGRLDGDARGDGHGPAHAAGRGLHRRRLLLHRPDARERDEERRRSPASRAGTCGSCRPTPSSGWIPTRCATPSAPTAPAGLRPFLVSPAAGTTNTGAVDPLDAVADVARGRGPVAPRRRRLRRLLPADRPRPRALPRHRARRQRDARPAQGPVPAVRDRRRRRPRRRGAPRRPLRGRRVPAGHAAVAATSRTTTSTRPSSRATCAASACGSRWCCTASTRSATALDEKLDLTDRLHAALARRPEHRDRLASAADRRAVPDARAGTRPRAASCSRGSTRRSACSCRAR